MENDLRRWMRLVETSNEPVLPEIKLQADGPKRKLILINGEKAGFLERESRDEFLGYNTYRKGRPNWAGTVKFEGKELRVGPTEKVAELLPKVIRLVRSYLIRKQHDADDGQSSTPP